MSQLHPFVLFLIFTVVPDLLMFITERLTLRFLHKSSWGYDWVRNTIWMHPNFISRCRYPMGVVSVLLFHMGHLLHLDHTGIFIWQHVGIWWFSFWIITDVSDGTIARYFDLFTEEGKSIDPLSDKLLLFPPLFYFAWLGYYGYTVVILFVVFDVIGQFSRYFIKEPAANLFGKAKTFLAVVTIVLLTVQTVYFGGDVWTISIASLWCAMALAFFSMFFKIVPNYWYANVLSILNFICGIIGLILVIDYNRPGLAFAAVFAGQFLDLFDGRAADKWGSTPRGELLDDIADGTSFGGTIAVIIWFALGQTPWALAIAVLHFGTTVYRLWRFLYEKRAAEITGGVHLFKGMPSPAAALVSGSIAMTLAPDPVKIAIILLTSMIMISHVPYIHFGRVILPGIPKLIKVILYTMILMAVLMAFSTGNAQWLYWTVFGCAFTYGVLGISRKKNQPPTPA